MKLSIKDFFSKFEQIYRTLWTWSYLQKKSIKKNFIFHAGLVSYKLLVINKPLKIKETYFYKSLYLQTDTFKFKIFGADDIHVG